MPEPTIFQVASAGYWVKFSTSNNRASDKPHRLRYCHCAKLTSGLNSESTHPSTTTVTLMVEKKYSQFQPKLHKHLFCWDYMHEKVRWRIAQLICPCFDQNTIFLQNNNITVHCGMHSPHHWLFVT